MYKNWNLNDKKFIKCYKLNDKIPKIETWVV